ncbi:hypothetical protein GDO81_002356 [Engystomops pustulosus]|uniref:Uncharacterized protein n=1 Tax=Engystomops pustulosus TaxID=76066 RepID=A0AAV7DJL8_ENGPU|nr:hypothetical protein GDO81_002356 [Engystomops pustulosus]
MGLEKSYGCVNALRWTLSMIPEHEKCRGVHAWSQDPSSDIGPCHRPLHSPWFTYQHRQCESALILIVSNHIIGSCGKWKH